MTDPRLSAYEHRPPVRADVVLSQLARAGVELEDQATDTRPETVSLRIGDESTGVLFCGDLGVVQRLIVEAGRQLRHLQHRRGSPHR